MWIFLTVLVALPGGAPVVMDYLAYDRANHRLWIPAGNTGNVDVYDTTTGKLSTVSGFPTAPRSGRAEPVGPSSASVGDKEVWIGNRANNQICGIDRQSLKKGACVTLPSMPDGVVYIPATREIWATTPIDSTLTFSDGNKVTGSLKLDGEPEGYAVAGDIFYTNLEDKDRTLAIDVKQKKVIANWPAGCGGNGPRGLAIDGGKLFVACSDGASVLDIKSGKQLSRLKTGGGVDNIDFQKGTLFIASGRDAQLTLAKANEKGELSVTSTVKTAPGARVVVADENGVAYVADSHGGKIIVSK